MYGKKKNGIIAMHQNPISPSFFLWLSIPSQGKYPRLPNIPVSSRTRLPIHVPVHRLLNIDHGAQVRALCPRGM
jgi:hypothetical protein